MISIFTNKSSIPTNEELKQALGSTYNLWKQLVDFTLKSYPGASEEWSFPGIKYGWSFRIKDKKRVLVYFLPRDRFFKVAFVFGEKATEKVLTSKVSANIKSELSAAKKYAEGRGIRIEVRDKKQLPELESMIKIKIES